jgi:hypothetical protein
MARSSVQFARKHDAKTQMEFLETNGATTSRYPKGSYGKTPVANPADPG